MRIVLEQGVYSGGLRGIGVYSRGLAEGLSRLPEAAGHEFLLFGFFFRDFARKAATLRVPAAPNFRLLLKRWPESLVTRAEWGWGLPVLDGLCRSAGAQVYHCPGARLPRLSRAAGVCTVHDLVPAVLPGVIPQAERGPWLAGVRAACERAAAVMVDSECTRRDLERLTGIGGKRVRVVHLGVDHGLFRPMDAGERRAARARLGLPERYLVSVGPWELRRNLETELEAFRIVSSRPAFSDAGLALAGEARGAYAESLRRRCADLGLAGKVSWLGYLPGEDLRGLYAAAAGFVYPSWYDGYNMPMHEAMACGCPAAVSEAGALPELGGDACLYFPPGDPAAMAAAMEVLLDRGSSRREALAAAGLRRAGLFRWEETARKALEAFLGAAEARG